MLRLATSGHRIFVQSNSVAHLRRGEANVAISPANYGIPIEFVTRLPQNDIADRRISELRKCNVTKKLIHYHEIQSVIKKLKTKII